MEKSKPTKEKKVTTPIKNQKKVVKKPAVKKAKKPTKKQRVVANLEPNMNGGTTITFKDKSKMKVENKYIDFHKVKKGSKI